MPSRPPRKPDATLDLSSHLLLLESLPDPFDPTGAFPQPGPVELEVGSGKGLFLSSASAAASERNFLGIELAVGYARLCAGKLAAGGRDNARIIQGDAGFLVRSLLPDACLAGMHVYFPDPWWRKKHRRRRIFTDEFVGLCSRVLKPGGMLHSWTDVPDYFEVIQALMDHHDDFETQPAPAERSPEHDMDYQTSFERKKRKEGFQISRGLWKRIDENLQE